MKHLLNFVSTVLGCMAGGSLFFLASRGEISWWMVALVFAWVIALCAYGSALFRESLDQAYARCLARHR